MKLHGRFILSDDTGTRFAFATGAAATLGGVAAAGTTATPFAATTTTASLACSGSAAEALLQRDP